MSCIEGILKVFHVHFWFPKKLGEGLNSFACIDVFGLCVAIYSDEVEFF
jgi:hypothetical protein